MCDYTTRFTMPCEPSAAHNCLAPFWSSWSMGPVHFIGLDSEAVFWCNAVQNHTLQMEWLKADLAAANAPAARAAHPWIVAYVHRPLWTSTRGSGPACNTTEQSGMRAAFEQVLHEAGVDLVLSGHVHNYERTWPIYNGTVLNGSTPEPYTDPGAAVHMVSAAGGNGESMSPFDAAQPHFSAFRSINPKVCSRGLLCSDYGFSAMTFWNESVVELDFWSFGDGTQPMHLADQVWLRQSHHGARLGGAGPS